MDNLNEEIKSSIDSSSPSIIKNKKYKSNLFLNIIIGISLLFILFYFLLSSPVREKDIIIHVSTNDSLVKVSKDLESKNVIGHSFILRMFISILSGDKHIPSGDYLFKKDESIFAVAWQISKGQHNISPIKITFKEGMTNEEMANLLANKIPSFRRDLFLSDTRSKQGYLFPDTYFFFPLSTTDEILNEITANFKKRISSIDKDIKSSNRSLSDIIIMASILEKEAKGKEDSSVISGILWKRIKKGMLLQVDIAPITYKNIGLPDVPINNPGLSSILSAINSEESPYLFYLHDDNGQVHYAIDFSEHRSNIARYLK